MSDRHRPRLAMRRLAAYALVPLSAVPFALRSPLVAPSVEQRVQHLRDQPVVPARAPAGAGPTSSVPGQRPARRSSAPAQRSVGE